MCSLRPRHPKVYGNGVVSPVTKMLWRADRVFCVTDRPRVLENPAVQALQERAHKVAEEGRAQQAEERAEDNNIVSRLVSATTSSEFRTATGAPPRQ